MSEQSEPDQIFELESKLNELIKVSLKDQILRRKIAAVSSVLDATGNEMAGTSGIGVEFYTHPIHPDNIPGRNDPGYLLFKLVMELAINERKPEFYTDGTFSGRVVIKTRLPNLLITVEPDRENPSQMTYTLERINPNSRPTMEMGDRAN